MDGFITIGTKLDTKQFDKQIAELERKAKEIEDTITASNVGEFKLGADDVSKLNAELERTKNKLKSLREEKAKAEQPRGFRELKAGVDDFGKGIQNAVKKVSKLVLGIFGVRSAFLALRRASSELATYNEEYGANLEYIRFALTQAIAPVLEYIVNLAMKLLAYINAIAQAWFGVNLFENASVDNFAKMKKGVNGVTGAVNELKKTLAGFDEINVLQEDGSVGTGGGGGGIALPTMDLANIQDIEIPEWVRWIMEHKAEILGLLTAVSVFFAGVKIAGFIKSLTGAEGAVLGLNTQLGKMVAGAALVAGGIALMIGPIDNLVKNWDDLTEAERLAQLGLLALGIALETFGLMMMGVSGPWAAVIALTTALTVLIVKWEEESIRINDVTQAQERLTQARENAQKQLQEYTQAVDRADNAQKKLDEAQRVTGESGEQLNEIVRKNKDNYKTFTDEQKEVYRLFLENEDAQKSLNEVATQTQKAIEDETDAFWLNKLATDGGKDAIIEWRDEVVKAMNEGSISSEDASRVFSKALTDIKEDSYDTFKEGLEIDIQDALDPRNYTNPLHWLEVNFGETFRKIAAWAQFLTDILMTMLGLGFVAPLRSKISGWVGSFGQAEGAIVYNDVPKLASGGIINQPGRGIPIARAIAGERGAEGVIPLTDSQQMEILGEAIGRYITINASIPVSMNGRLISRELRQVQADQEFAYNS